MGEKTDSSMLLKVAAVNHLNLDDCRPDRQRQVKMAHVSFIIQSHGFVIFKIKTVVQPVMQKFGRPFLFISH